MKKTTENAKWHSVLRKLVGRWYPRDIIMLVLVSGLLWQDEPLSASLLAAFRRVVAIWQPLTSTPNHEHHASSRPSKD